MKNNLLEKKMNDKEKNYRLITEKFEGFLNENSNVTDMHKIMVFAFNYPPGFIKKVWSDVSPDMVNHLQSKFDNYYKKYGSSSAFNYFYMDLDSENQHKIENWISTNFNG